MNACRQIHTAGLAPGIRSAPRVRGAGGLRQVLQYELHGELVSRTFRPGARRERKSAALQRCLRDRHPLAQRTNGPLTLRQIDSARAPASTHSVAGRRCPGRQPAAADRREHGGRHGGGLALRAVPSCEQPCRPPVFAPGTPREGPNGWWAVWNREVLQDYRQFASVHRGTCNILFADGGVRDVADVNKTGFSTMVFRPLAGNGFADDKVEVSAKECMSLYSLKRCNFRTEFDTHLTREGESHLTICSTKGGHRHASFRAASLVATGLEIVSTFR